MADLVLFTSVGCPPVSKMWIIFIEISSQTESISDFCSSVTFFSTSRQSVKVLLGYREDFKAGQSSLRNPLKGGDGCKLFLIVSKWCVYAYRYQRA